MLGARDDDCGRGGWRGSSLDGGQEGADAVNDAEEVRVHDLVEIGGVRPGAAEADAGIEGDEVDFAYFCQGLALYI